LLWVACGRDNSAHPLGNRTVQVELPVVSLLPPASYYRKASF
jgi:hypothetical protein